MARRRSRGSKVSRKRSRRGRGVMKRSRVSRKRSRVSRKRSRVSRKNRTRSQVGGAWKTGEILVNKIVPQQQVIFWKYTDTTKTEFQGYWLHTNGAIGMEEDPATYISNKWRSHRPFSKEVPNFEEYEWLGNPPPPGIIYYDR